MNTQQLQCFLCVADKLNFTRAAEELFLSAPTVTHHIQKLEEELGVQLFVRTPKSVRLTENGMIFYNDAREILDKMILSKKRAAEIISGDFKFLHIGCTSSVEVDRLYPLLADFREEFPKVYPRIHVQDYHQSLNSFKNKQMDLFLCSGEMIRGASECTFKPVCAAGEKVVAAADSPFAARTELSFDQLQEQTLLVLHPKLIPFSYENAMQEKISLHTKTHPDIFCENISSCLLLAKSGYGTAILPAFYIPPVLEDAVKIPLKEHGSIQYGIAYHSKRREPYLRRFVSLFLEKYTL